LSGIRRVHRTGFSTSEKNGASKKETKGVKKNKIRPGRGKRASGNQRKHCVKILLERGIPCKAVHGSNRKLKLVKKIL